MNQLSWPMSDTAEVTRAGVAPNTADGSPSPTNIARYGHESRIAQPSTFLLPRGQNRAMQDKPLSAVDKDQLSGLVSIPWSPKFGAGAAMSSFKLRQEAVLQETHKADKLELYRKQSGISSRSAPVTTFFLSPFD